MRDLNTEVTLRIVQSKILESAQELSQVEPATLLYPQDTPKIRENIETIHLLMKVLEENKCDFGEFCNTRIYNDYFDNRQYHIE